ncbi:DDE-Tnp-IS240 domain-containing protein [Escherichia coli]|nr:DDE-Tnp-IS240 domain-containing protein [Escherichia coli]
MYLWSWAVGEAGVNNCRFLSLSRRNSKAAYRFLRVNQQRENVADLAIHQHGEAPAYGRALALLKREGRCPSDVEHRQIKYRNNVINAIIATATIIGATLGFKSMKTAYATISVLSVMRALRKGQAQHLLW